MHRKVKSRFPIWAENTEEKKILMHFDQKLQIALIARFMWISLHMRLLIWWITIKHQKYTEYLHLNIRRRWPFVPFNSDLFNTLFIIFIMIAIWNAFWMRIFYINRFTYRVDLLDLFSWTFMITSQVNQGESFVSFSASLFEKINKIALFSNSFDYVHTQTHHLLSAYNVLVFLFSFLLLCCVFN